MSKDQLGSLVWTGLNYSEPFDFKVQTYKGKPVLTFWSGELLNGLCLELPSIRADLTVITGYGNGSYYILDQSYSEIAHFSPVGFENGSLLLVHLAGLS